MYYDVIIHSQRLIDIIVKSEATELDYPEYSVQLFTFEAAAIYLIGLKARFPGIRVTKRGVDLGKMLKLYEEHV